MNLTLSAEAGHFFTKNGWVELEISHPDFSIENRRDFWRSNEALKQFLTRKLAPVVLALSGKSSLRLGCDQGFLPENKPSKSCAVKELFSIQNFALGLVIADQPKTLARKSELGIIPTPSHSQHILFFRPDLILDWPHLDSKAYVAMYVLPNAVYVHNAKDPAGAFLKGFGYQYGDLLKTEHHPQVISRS